MQTIWARTVLGMDGWVDDVLLTIGDEGRIASITPGVASTGTDGYGAIVAAPVNLHSHAFQRAMAGLTEARGPDSNDSFWTWRKLMFRFLDHLTPDDVRAITAFAQMEMLQAGFGAVCEFHYLHHQPGGAPYDNIAEMADSIAAATAQSGIGLTLLPVLYEQGGCDGRGLTAGQIRFGNTADQFAAMVERSASALAQLPRDTQLGVAPHSLRAVSVDGLQAAVELLPNAPVHLHLAEQVAEVEEVCAAYGDRPVSWLLDNHDVDQRWCLIHATQMTEDETVALAGTGAVAGLCPITESSLGDGIFEGIRFAGAGGRFGIGSDSNIKISLSEELRTLEYSQRLRDRGRAMFATAKKSTGRALLDRVSQAGAIAAGRESGIIAVGARADLLALDLEATELVGKSGDMMLDAWIFAGSDRLITDVWSAGRHMVRSGQHINQRQITAEYRKVMSSLLARI